MLRPGRSTAAILFAVAAVAPACGADEAPRPPERSCVTVVWQRPSRAGAKLEVIGDFSGWATPGAPMLPGEDGWRFAALALPPGEQGYLVVEDGEAHADALAPLSTFHAGREVSLVTVPDCATPAFEVDRADVDERGVLTVDARFLARAGGPALDPGTLALSVEGGPRLSVDAADPATGAVRASAKGLARGKHHVVLAGADAEGRRAEAARASVWSGASPRAWGDGVLYQVMIDRFRGDGGAALAPPKTPTSRAGGTLDGVRAEIDKGTFEALGVSALWLSPVYVNPEGERVGRDGHPSEAYHGYWPLDSRAVDARLGGEAALERLVAAAHARGLRVLVDFVPNHVYEDNPRYRDHTKDGWFGAGADACVCGVSGCDWGAHIETCWFAPYLPDVRWQHPDAARAQIDDAVFWTDRFDLDGLRIDAVPMMPRSATRRVSHAVRARDARPGGPFLLGEIFTGPGAGGFDSIRRFLGARAWQGLDAAFDFPLMWALRSALASGAGSFADVEAELARSEAGLAGSGSTLARMVDNHDTTRFVSEAVGDAGGDPWSSPPSQPDDAATLARLEAALAIVLTLPGVPVLYYGDEVGLAGGSDPDSRRVMPDEASLSPARARVLATARRLGRLRACTRSLREGARTPLVVAADRYAFARDAGDGTPVIVTISRAAGPVAVPRAGLPAGLYVDVLSGDKVSMADEGMTLDVAPIAPRVLVPDGAACP
jgi:glycosidase